MLTFTDPRFWLDAAQWLVAGVLATLLWLRRPGQTAQTELRKLSSDIKSSHAALAQRVSMLEHQVAAAPTRVEIARLEGDVKLIQAQMEGQNEQLLAIQRSVTRVEDFLLANARHGSHTSF